MKSLQISLLILLFSTAMSATRGAFGQQTEEDPVYSGPQVSESLPEFEMKRIFGKDSGNMIDIVTASKAGPIVLIFFHERSRPAFAMMRAIANYAETRKPGELTTAVCFLSKDPTETTDWVERVVKHLPQNGVIYGVSKDGMDGPGSYGLNRNVSLTILVADKGKVVHNSALVQPSLETDGKKVLKAIAEVMGDETAPDIRELSGQSRMARQNSGSEPNMRPWLAPIIRRTATAEEIDQAAKALEAHCAKDEAARKAVGRIANTVVNSGKLKNYGTPHAQDYLKKWAKQFGSENKRPEEMKPDHDSIKPGGSR